MNRSYCSLLGLVVAIFMLSVACKPKQSSEANVQFKNISVSEAKAIHSREPDVLFLDVRTPEETAQGIIDNALTLDFRGTDFEEKLAAFDKDKSYIVYCRSGSRSASASEVMQHLGFKDVRNMLGGYTAWSEIKQ